MVDDAHNGVFVANELGDDRKPTGRFVVKDRLGKVIAGPFDSEFDADCQRQLGIDTTYGSNFDQES